MRWVKRLEASGTSADNMERMSRLPVSAGVGVALASPRVVCSHKTVSFQRRMRSPKTKEDVSETAVDNPSIVGLERERLYLHDVYTLAQSCGRDIWVR